MKFENKSPQELKKLRSHIAEVCFAITADPSNTFKTKSKITPSCCFVLAVGITVEFDVGQYKVVISVSTGVGGGGGTGVGAGAGAFPPPR